MHSEASTLRLFTACEGRCPFFQKHIAPPGAMMGMAIAVGRKAQGAARQKKNTGAAAPCGGFSNGFTTI